MSEQIKNLLNPGEEILWSGKPEEFTVLDKTHKSAFLRKAIIGGVITLLLCVGYYIAVVGNGEPKWIIFAILVSMYVLIVFGEFSDGSKLRKITYYLTDARLLIENDSVTDIPLDKVKQYRFDTDPDGHEYLIIGECVMKGKIRKMRSFAVTPVLTDSETGVCRRAVLYAVPNTGTLKKQLTARFGK